MAERTDASWVKGRKLRWFIWTFYLLLWSGGLLTTYPSTTARALLQEYSMPASKTLHVVAYAGLALLTGWVACGRAYRWLLLGLAGCHALGTEFLQQFVISRTTSWRDVGLNFAGLALGMLIGWKWWFGTEPAHLPNLVQESALQANSSKPLREE